jgi:hypothetical protein
LINVERCIDGPLLVMTYNLQLSTIQLSTTDKLVLSVCGLLFLEAIRRSVFNLKPRTTQLLGPPSSDYPFISGTIEDLFTGARAQLTLTKWIPQYGNVFSVPWTFGERQVVLCDPKAVGHFYAGDTTVYGSTGMSKQFLKLMVGV